MSTINESESAGEQVLHFVRGSDVVARPADMQCVADTEEGRCEDDKYYNQDVDFWSRWCKKHSAQEEKARTKGGERLNAFPS